MQSLRRCVCYVVAHPDHPPAFAVHRLGSAHGPGRTASSCGRAFTNVVALADDGLTQAMALPSLPGHLPIAEVAGPGIVQLTLAAAAAAYVAAAWPLRPRGWCRTDLLEVRDSPVEGRGLFAARDIACGTVLGQYPGRPRSPQAMLAKIQGPAPLAKSYCFQTRHGTMLDPTDAAGRPSSRPAPGLPWFPIDVTLCFANEPPAGSGAGVNAVVEDDPSDAGILFVAACRIAAGAEVFVDYGSDYDRSGYR